MKEVGLESSSVMTKLNFNILIVEDHILVSEGLRMLLSTYPQMSVVGAATNMADALEMLNTRDVDVVLLDLRLHGEWALDKIRELRSHAPQVKVLAITASTDANLHKQAVTNGASGVFMKFEPSSLLIKAIEKVGNGEVWIDRTTTAEILHKLTSRQGTREEHDLEERIKSLTPRERDIIKCLSSGVTNQGIADILGISEKSVRNALSNIFGKLLVENRLELLMFSTKHRLDGAKANRYDSAFDAE